MIQCLSCYALLYLIGWKYCNCKVCSLCYNMTKWLKFDADVPNHCLKFRISKFQTLCFHSKIREKYEGHWKIWCIHMYFSHLQICDVIMWFLNANYSIWDNQLNKGIANYNGNATCNAIIWCKITLVLYFMKKTKLHFKGNPAVILW